MRSANSKVITELLALGTKASLLVSKDAPDSKTTFNKYSVFCYGKLDRERFSGSTAVKMVCSL